MPKKRPGEKRALPTQWEELTASDFPAAVRKAKRVCVLPIGVIEKHGPHLPLGTDVMAARAASLRAAAEEYAVVFPSYYFGQIHEAKHQPGCIAVQPDLLTALLQDVCDEIGRNGFEKILIVNGHGGNINWLNFFCQTQLARPRDYAVYVVGEATPEDVARRVEAMRKTDTGGHADEVETSRMLVIAPHLVHLDRAGDESGRAKRRLKATEEAFTGIFWYADYPDHYAGDARPATAALGEVALAGWVKGLVKVLRAVKQDTMARKLQAEFHRRAEAPSRSAARGKRS